jgi:hypothetical protein
MAEVEVPNPEELHERGSQTFGRRVASVSILSTSRQMFWFSLVLAVLGAVLTLNAYSRLFALPFLRHH